MSNPYSRYWLNFTRYAKPNMMATFPRHVFMRSPNFISNVYDRVGNRTDCFNATFIHLTERFNGKEVYLVGTANASTMLAQRTQKLIADVKPDVVMVQSSEKWWDVVKLLKYVNSQEELDQYRQYTKDALAYRFPFNTRKLVLIPRLYLATAAFRWMFRFGRWDPLTPGIEIKLACEEAEKVGAKLEFLGQELDKGTYHRLLHETRFNYPTYLLKRYQQSEGLWGDELVANRAKISLVGARTFTEQCLDEYLMNWYVQACEMFFPAIKRIFVDRRDEDIFQIIDKHESKKIVVVVNQWHMEGVEHLWCQRYGQRPRGTVYDGEVNPIGDMDLRRGLFYMLYNNLHRHISSANQKSVPSTFASWIIGYTREAVAQYEHRDM